MSIKAMSTGKRFRILLAIALVSAGVITTLGRDIYLTGPGSFTASYPATVGTKLASCGVCHVNPAGGGSRNSYGTAWANNGKSFATIEPLDSDRDAFTNIQEIVALTWPGDPADHPGPTDTTPPVVTFSIPSTSNSLTVSISLSAADNVGVTGYFLTESSTPPSASAAGWTASPPASYTFATAGAKTLRAYAKDGNGNVSAGVSASTTITLSDTVPPTVTSFAVPTSSTSLTISVTLVAADNIGVTGYLVTESAAAPLASTAGWTSSPPANYTFATAGTKTLRAYAKDGAGNVSPGVSASTTITSTVTSLKNLIAAHNRNSTQYRKDCSNCHLQVVLEQSLEEPAIHTAHLTMAYFVPGKEANAKCRFCHRSADLLERSAANVRRQVDAALCAVCHGPSRPTKQFYKTGSSPTQPDGAALYTLVCSGCHGDLAQSKVRGESASEIQKKINENEGGMQPLSILTSLEIEAIARALAQ